MQDKGLWTKTSVEALKASVYICMFDQYGTIVRKQATMCRAAAGFPQKNGPLIRRPVGWYSVELRPPARRLSGFRSRRARRFGLFGLGPSEQAVDSGAFARARTEFRYCPANRRQEIATFTRKPIDGLYMSVEPG